ncbi:hypothetical protein J2S78_000584 [Salibacterium salarium]|nr:hypothetical protein [Salibacterium salarium]
MSSTAYHDMVSGSFGLAGHGRNITSFISEVKWGNTGVEK